MLLSLNWLKEFVEIPKNLTPEELAEKLTNHTVEVEKVERQADKYKGNDVIFEVDNKSITHRADLWSHYGMARDISAFLNTKFKPITVKIPLTLPRHTRDRLFIKGEKIKVKVEDFKLCPRYLAVALDGIKVAPSPEWLADRLSAAGSRPINNIVDATNYVMLELGQPLHAFDKNFIDSIIVRRAKAGETMETLDGQTRKLEPDMLVIANQTKPVAVAGVMGGLSSEINSATSSIIIESANFNFDSVRKTAQKLGLRTEASIRFEKGLDPNLAELGLKRVVELIIKICPGAKVAGNLADEKKFKLNQGPIVLDLKWLNRRVGHEFELKYVKQVLEKLGFAVKEFGGKFSITIPTWRAVRDVSLAEDIVEEVARIYGYNNIKPAMPEARLRPPFLLAEKALARKIKNILAVGAGLTEVYNYSFTSREQLEKIKFDPARAIKLANPLTDEMTMLRPSLAAGLAENIKTNQAQEDFIGLYEIGNIFLNQPGELNLPWQEKHLGLALAGEGEADLFRKLKGVIEYLLGSLNLETEFEKDESGDYKGFLPEPALSGANVVEMTKAAIMANGQEIGRVAELDNGTSGAFGLKKKAALAEISLSQLLKAVKNSPARQYGEPPKYPAASRDLALVVNEKILYNNIVEEIKKFSDLIKQAELFDVYQGGKLAAAEKSLAFHIIYQADRTLTSKEVDEVQGKLVKHLEKEFEAKIRNF